MQESRKTNRDSQNYREIDKKVKKGWKDAKMIKETIKNNRNMICFFLINQRANSVCIYKM